MKSAINENAERLGLVIALVKKSEHLIELHTFLDSFRIRTSGKIRKIFFKVKVSHMEIRVEIKKSSRSRAHSTICANEI